MGSGADPDAWFGNLTFCAALYGMGKRETQERARSLLARFGLEKTGKRPIKAYSKGMKRKLTIAAGIIHSPPFFFSTNRQRASTWPARARSAA